MRARTHTHTHTHTHTRLTRHKLLDASLSKELSLPRAGCATGSTRANERLFTYLCCALTHTARTSAESAAAAAAAAPFLCNDDRAPTLQKSPTCQRGRKIIAYTRVLHHSRIHSAVAASMCVWFPIYAGF